MYPSIGYDSLFYFIKKNKTLPNAIAEVERDKVDLLADAIEKGDYQAEVFHDENCSLYLLFLLKERAISFEQGMTVYSYLLALAQFTEQQPLQAKDHDVKALRHISVKRLVNQQELTKEGKTFLESFFKRMNDMYYNFDFKELEAFILQLPPSEHLFLGIPYFFNTHNDSDIESLAQTLSKNIPFVGTTKSADETILWLPSYSFINFILHKMSPNPMQMYPVFGSVNLKSLRSLHVQSYHPVSLYAVSVLSNPSDAEGLRCGCFFMWLHDVGHVFWASLLTKEERGFLLEEIPKRLELLQSKVTHEDQEELTKRIQKSIEIAADFNLTYINCYANPQTRLSTYIRRQVMANGLKVYGFSQVEFTPLGCLEDHLYYWITKLALINQDDKGWQLISSGLKIGNYHRRIAFTNALNTLVDVNNGCFVGLDDGAIDWQAWLELMDSSTDSKTLWDKVVKEREHELLQLITQEGLAFFHPYHPMTDELHSLFRAYLVTRIEEKQTLSFSYYRREKEGAVLNSLRRNSFFSSDTKRLGTDEHLDYYSLDSLI